MTITPIMEMMLAMPKMRKLEELEDLEEPEEPDEHPFQDQILHYQIMEIPEAEGHATRRGELRNWNLRNR